VIKYCTLFFFAGLCSANPTPASACSPPSPNSPIYSASVTSAVPAKVAPKAATQLKVAALYYEQSRGDFFDVGKITLRVKQVINGKFSEPTVRLNVTNVDNCNSRFEPQVGDVFITVLPMNYSDGKPVIDRSGKQEYASLFYKSEELYAFENMETPQFAEYSPMARYSFYDPKKFACLYEGNDDFDWSAEAWRRCVGPGEYVALNCERKQDGKLVCEQDDQGSIRPPELRRGYSFWNYYLKTISATLLVLAILLGMGCVFLRKRLRQS
jgi:hypothetical protein